MAKWKIKDCDCRWCRYRPLKTRGQVANVLAMQLHRRAGKRLVKVFRQLDRHLRIRRTEGDALLTLRDFMQTCFKWGAFLEYVEISGRCFGDDLALRQSALKMIVLMDKIYEYPEASDYRIAVAVCSRGVEINARIASLLGRKIPEPEKIEATLLKKSMRKLVKLRNTWTNAEHRYFEDEVPIFELEGARDRASDLILYFDDVDISNKPLDLLARIAASRLTRMYGKLWEILKRLGAQDIFTKQIQARMDFCCRMVDRCLSGGQENKNGARNDNSSQLTQEGGNGGSGLGQDSTEYGSAAARERGVA